MVSTRISLSHYKPLHTAEGRVLQENAVPDGDSIRNAVEQCLEGVYKDILIYFDQLKVPLNKGKHVGIYLKLNLTHVSGLSNITFRATLAQLTMDEDVFVIQVVRTSKAIF